jgi:hypothetical protein
MTLRPAHTRALWCYCGHRILAINLATRSRFSSELTSESDKVSRAMTQVCLFRQELWIGLVKPVEVAALYSRFQRTQRRFLSFGLDAKFI